MFCVAKEGSKLYEHFVVVVKVGFEEDDWDSKFFLDFVKVCCHCFCRALLDVAYVDEYVRGGHDDRFLVEVGLLAVERSKYR